MYIYHGTWDHSNDILHPISIYIYPLLTSLSKGYVNLSLFSLLGNGWVMTFPWQRWNFGTIVFYAVHVVWKVSRPLFSSRSFFFIYFKISGDSWVRTQNTHFVALPGVYYIFSGFAIINLWLWLRYRRNHFKKFYFQHSMKPKFRWTQDYFP
jgi:hypothetical protein